MWRPQILSATACPRNVSSPTLACYLSKEGKGKGRGGGGEGSSSNQTCFKQVPTDWCAFPGLLAKGPERHPSGKSPGRSKSLLSAVQIIQDSGKTEAEMDEDIREQIGEAREQVGLRLSVFSFTNYTSGVTGQSATPTGIWGVLSSRSLPTRSTLL